MDPYAYPGADAANARTHTHEFRGSDGHTFYALSHRHTGPERHIHAESGRYADPDGVTYAEPDRHSEPDTA